MTDQMTDCARFRQLFLAHQPAHQAWMQPPGSPAKYLKKFHAITDAELVAHLAGTLTIAAPLLSAAGTAYAAALDLDTGGAAAIAGVLAAAMRCGFTAFGCAGAGDVTQHDGGHVWLLFDGAVEAERLHAVAATIAAAAGVTAELYPTRKTLRLPLGVHRWTGRRGQVLLQDGTRIDLDAGQAAMSQALTALAALPRNRVALLLPAPEPPILNVPRAHQHRPGAAVHSIAAYNAATDLVALLEGYGGRVAERHRGGGAIMHCPCGQHAHGDAHPSLAVLPARNARYGQFIAVGYAPACRFFTETGAVIDACAVVCLMEHLTPAEVLHQGRRTGAGAGATTSGAASHAPAGGQLSLLGEGGQP